jgi:hypothetical protein
MDRAVRCSKRRAGETEERDLIPGDVADFSLAGRNRREKRVASVANRALRLNTTITGSLVIDLVAQVHWRRGVCLPLSVIVCKRGRVWIRAM